MAEARRESSQKRGSAMRMFRRTAVAACLAGGVASMAAVSASAGPLPTSIAAVKAAAPSTVVEEGWGAGALVGGLAAGSIIAAARFSGGGIELNPGTSITLQDSSNLSGNSIIT